MNTLSTANRVRIVAALVEGNSLRSISRMTGKSLNTITKLLVELGDACMAYHDSNVRNLSCKRIQCDEIWSFVGAKMKNVREENADKQGRATCGHGPRWTPTPN